MAEDAEGGHRYGVTKGKNSVGGESQILRL